MHPVLTLANRLVLDLPTSEGWKTEFTIGYPEMHRSGVSRSLESLVQCPNRYNTEPPRIYKIGSIIWAGPFPKNQRSRNINIYCIFCTTSQLDCQYLRIRTRYRRTENGVANCNLSSVRAVNFVNVGPQTARNLDRSFDRSNSLALRGSRSVVRTSLSRFVE